MLPYPPYAYVVATRFDRTIMNFVRFLPVTEALTRCRVVVVAVQNNWGVPSFVIKTRPIHIGKYFFVFVVTLSEKHVCHDKFVTTRRYSWRKHAVLCRLEDKSLRSTVYIYCRLYVDGRRRW